MGYSVKSINNAWIDDKNTTYNGINVKLDKQIGEEVITLEVQFHTEESYLTKENYTHDIYKIERGLFANEIDIKTAHDIQVSLQEIVEKPKHIGRIGNEEKIIKKNTQAVSELFKACNINSDAANYVNADGRISYVAIDKALRHTDVSQTALKEFMLAVYDNSVNDLICLLDMDTSLFLRVFSNNELVMSIYNDFNILLYAVCKAFQS